MPALILAGEHAMSPKQPKVRFCLGVWLTETTRACLYAIMVTNADTILLEVQDHATSDMKTRKRANGNSVYRVWLKAVEAMLLQTKQEAKGFYAQRAFERL